jgi:hypothetical protein
MNLISLPINFYEGNTYHLKSDNFHAHCWSESILHSRDTLRKQVDNSVIDTILLFNTNVRTGRGISTGTGLCTTDKIGKRLDLNMDEGARDMRRARFLFLFECQLNKDFGSIDE